MLIYIKTIKSTQNFRMDNKSTITFRTLLRLPPTQLSKMWRSEYLHKKVFNSVLELGEIWSKLTFLL